MPGRLVRILIVLALAASAAVVTAPTGQTAPLEAKRRQAEALEERIRSQGGRLSAAAEDFNEARLERQRVEADAASARSLVVAAERRWAGHKEQLGRRARLMYMHPSAAFEALFGAKSMGELSRARVYGEEVMITDAKLIMAAEHARHEVMQRARTLEKLREQAERKEDELAANRARVQQELNSQRRLLRNVRGEVAQLIRADRERALRAAAAAEARAAAAPSAQAPARVRRSAPAAPAAEEAPSGPAPPVRGGAAKAVATARAQLGKPYKWGASGPDSFDCSGLTMYAWASAGVSLPHSSRAQYASLPKVSRSELRPGDLVFYGSPIHHVGIYEGGGTMINAPETGENVRRDSINRRDYVGAARP